MEIGKTLISRQIDAVGTTTRTPNTSFEEFYVFFSGGTPASRYVRICSNPSTGNYYRYYGDFYRSIKYV